MTIKSEPKKHLFECKTSDSVTENIQSEQAKAKTVSEAAQANPYLKGLTEREIKCYLNGAKFGAQWQQSQPCIKQWVPIEQLISHFSDKIEPGVDNQAFGSEFTKGRNEAFRMCITALNRYLPNSTTTPKSDQP